MCVYKYMHVCVYTCGFVGVVHMSMHVFIRMHMCMWVCACVYIWGVHM